MGEGSSIRQLLFNFFESLKPREPLRREAKTVPPPRLIIEEPPPASPEPAALTEGRDGVLETEARELLDGLGLHEGVAKLRIVWNPKLRSTAGYAKWPQWIIELNPRLREFEGQIERTMKHELAHLIAYARAGRKRIEPHGPEWQKACAQIGIPNESARHTLPLPRSKQDVSCRAMHRIRPRFRTFATRAADAVMTTGTTGIRPDLLQCNNTDTMEKL